MRSGPAVRHINLLQCIAQYLKNAKVRDQVSSRVRKVHEAEMMSATTSETAIAIERRLAKEKAEILGSCIILDDKKISLYS